MTILHILTIKLFSKWMACLFIFYVHICTYMCLCSPVPCFIVALVISMSLKQLYCIKTKLSVWRGSRIMEAQFCPGGLVEHNILHIYIIYIKSFTAQKNIAALSDAASIYIFITIHCKVFTAQVFCFYTRKR